MLFALGSGIGVPSEIVQALDSALTGMTADKVAEQAKSAPRATTSGAERLGWGSTQNFGSGVQGAVPASIPAAPSEKTPDQMAVLANVHLELTKLVAPAKPVTLLLLNDEQRNYPLRHSFGAVPLVRKMLALAVISLILMLGIALSKKVNSEIMSKGLLGAQGIPLLVNEIFLVSASAVGATLANLKRLDRYVSNCTYDRRYESSYWTRVVMGIISGVILSQIIYGGFNSASAGVAGKTSTGFSDIGQPILALLGGFSAELVNDILTHFISVIRNAFGDSKSPEAAGDPIVTGTQRP